MRDHQGRDGGARHSAATHPGGTSRDQYRRKRHLLAAHPRSRPRACEYPQRDLPRQHLDGAPLPDDAAAALAGSGEDADISRQLETPLALWHTDPEFRARILSEWDKIEPYK